MIRKEAVFDKFEHARSVFRALKDSPSAEDRAKAVGQELVMDFWKMYYSAVNEFSDDILFKKYPEMISNLKSRWAKSVENFNAKSENIKLAIEDFDEDIAEITKLIE